MITVYVEYEHDDEFKTAREIANKLKERLAQAGHVNDIDVLVTDMEGN